MWPMNSRGRYPSIDLEQLVAESEQAPVANPTVQQRSVFADAPPSRQPESSHGLYKVVSRGTDISRLTKDDPDDIIPNLRDLAVIKVGEFHSNDPELLKAFQTKRMVTYAFDDVHIPEYETTWKGILRREGLTLLPADGWTETMTLVVYCINIKFAANALGEGILRPLLAKDKKGFADDDIWDFPSVRAVIDFKWTHWASKYMLAVFILYLGWLLCFVGFMIIYIEKNLDKDYQNNMDDDDKTLAVFAYLLDIGALLFMCPFVVIEYNTIVYYKWQSLQMWNVLDALAYVFQCMVSFIHFTHVGFASRFYVTLLAAHCTLLFIKAQYFLRVLGPRAAYVETLRILIFKVRYFLIFIVLSMISAALSLAVLYKWDNDRKADNEDFNGSLEDFSSVPRALVTVYSIILGNFESSYVFETTNGVVKGIFFLLFRLFMPITVLNLLIAVMTESYKAVMTKQIIIYYRCKAEVIDKMELSLPKRFYPKFKCYVHFIVCENRNKLSEEQSTPTILKALTNFENGIKEELQALRNKVESLERKVDQSLPNSE